MTNQAAPFAATYFHGTRADLKPGDLIGPGRESNFGKRNRAAFVYLTGTLDAAIWGAELAVGDASPRIYAVVATGPLEDDPNLTDKKFPGNPTRSFRTRQPLRIVGELVDWAGHTPDQIKTMKAGLAELERQGVGAIED